MKNEKAIKQMSLGHLAKYIERESKKMEANGNQPWQIAEHSLKISKAFGIDLPESLVKYPAGHHKAQKENGGIRMFQFNQVLDQATGERYHVVSACFEGDKYDYTPDGANWYLISLEPIDPEKESANGVDLVIHNDGVVEISKNLHGERYIKTTNKEGNSVLRIIAVQAIIDGDTLIIPKEESKLFHEICEADELMVLKGSTVEVIRDIKEGDTTLMEMLFQCKTGKCRELHIQENGFVFLSNEF